MRSEIEKSATSTARGGTLTSDAQPSAPFQEAVGVATAMATTSMASTPIAGSFVVVRGRVGGVVRVPYDAAREAARRENLIANGLLQPVRPATANRR